MVKIRLKRLGRKKRPFYRIVVMNDRDRREGAPLAEIGYYNPLSRELKLDKQAAQSWLGKGAIATDVVQRLLKHAPDSGELIILEKAKQERLSKKAQSKLDEQKKQAEEAAAAKAAAPEPAPVVEAPTPEPAAEAVSETPSVSEAEATPVAEEAAPEPSAEG